MGGTVRLLWVLVGLLLGACQTSPEPLVQAPEPTPIQLETLALSVPTMICPSTCVVAVLGALENLDGVERVDIDFDNRVAYVTADMLQVPLAVMLVSLEEAGFPGELLAAGSLGAGLSSAE